MATGPDQAGENVLCIQCDGRMFRAEKSVSHCYLSRVRGSPFVTHRLNLMPTASRESRAPISARTAFAILALALGGFGIGATEFAAMGMLPDFARELLPQLWAASEEQAIAQAGWLISLYALGVVVGAPTIGAFAAKFPRRTLLLVFVATFVVGSVFTALLPNFELVLVSRFVAALCHGAYFGVAALVAAELMGEGRQALGISLVILGLTVSNMLGVPLITWVAQLTNFRVAYLLIAGIFAATFVAVYFVVPWQPGDKNATIRRELAAFRRPQLWFALAMGAIGFGGLFAVYSYISPLVTDVAGLGEEVMPWTLFLFGAGMTVGTLIGGWLADRGIRRAVMIGFAAMLLAQTALWLWAGQGWVALPLLFFTGLAAQILAPTLQMRLISVSGDAQTMAATLVHSALNIGNSLGAFCGGLAIAAGWGYASAVLTGIALTVAGVCIAAVSFSIERAGQRALGLAATTL